MGAISDFFPPGLNENFDDEELIHDDVSDEHQEKCVNYENLQSDILQDPFEEVGRT